jgi:hypothetical protein
MQEFSKVLQSNGYRLVPVKLQFEFGELSSFEVSNFNEKYHEISKRYLEALSREKLSEPFENFKNDYIALRAVAPKDSLRFANFDKDLRATACLHEIPDNTEILESFNSKITKLKKKFKDTQNALDNVQKSIPSFFAQIPKQVPASCDENYQLQVENKIKVIEVLGWDCKQE